MSIKSAIVTLLTIVLILHLMPWWLFINLAIMFAVVVGVIVGVEQRHFIDQ